jgi:predicted DNA-binding transcriptional regulator AlpA
MKTSEAEARDFLTIKDVARRTKKSERWVRDRLNDGTLPSRKVAGSRLIAVADYARAFGLDQPAA